MQSLPAGKPNIIFILADDLGWGDLSCYSRPDYVTSNLDRMASEGVRLTDCYSASATCSPTRIALMTGRYPARHPAGLPEPILQDVHGSGIGLEPGFPALPRLLGQNGYRTALLGKWHCGVLPEFGPLKSGFDEFFGMQDTGVSYANHLDQFGDNGLFDGESAARASGYLTDLLTDKACDFIKRHQQKPFYLSLHYNAPHWPWETRETPGEEGKLPATVGGSIASFASMVKAMDEGVGRVLDTLDKLRLTGKTLVVFTSDNGGERYSYHYPLTGHIRLLREGGIRVPGIVRWPQMIPPRQTSSQLTITMDWTEMFLQLAGASCDARFPSDGVNLLPVFTGEQSCFERTLYWRTPRMDAVRRGPWKYLRDHAAGTEALFNLTRDIREYHDFRGAHPALFDQLKSSWAEWNAGVLPRPFAAVLPPEQAAAFQLH